MHFSTTILRSGPRNTGIEVPDEIVEGLGGGRRPAVVVTVNGYTYRSTVAVMGGKNLISLSAAHREASGIEGGDEVEVDLELDTAPRLVEVPDDLRAALDAEPAAAAAYAGLSFSRQKAVVGPVTEAKTDATRQRRIEAAVRELAG